MTTPDQVRQRLEALVDGESGGPPGWPERIAAFLHLLEARNRDVNLISRKTAGEALERHVLPSLAVLRVVPAGVPLRVLDVGTGGGFPGIPLGILRPRVRLDLVESVGKKCDFLEEAVRELRLDAVVHRERIERPGDALGARGPFERAFARALGDEMLLERAVRGLLADRGQLWVFDHPGRGEVPWPEKGPVTSLRRLPAPSPGGSSPRV